MEKEEAFELAAEAARQMFHDRGPGHAFPFDAIWQYLPDGIIIPPKQKPALAGKLVTAGLVERTGGQTKTSSKDRANTFTAEYRFGRALAPAPTPGSEASQLIKDLQQKMDTEGYIVSPAELANFFLAMMASPLVILSGISGTGKSLLPRKFARHTKAEFSLIPVQPQWSDNSDLFGYVPTLSPENYIDGKLIESLREAKRNPEKLFIAVLDEMNLAPVEHYLSDFLSVAETRVRSGGEITTDPLPIDLPQKPSAGEDPYKELRGLTLASNLRVIGTANMDESTHSFSPKVLDRAFTIEFDDPDLTGFASGIEGAETDFSPLTSFITDKAIAINIQEARDVSQDLFEEVALLLNEIQQILSPAGIKFGYRTRDAILLYLHFWKTVGLEDVIEPNAALDFCLLQKVLPKISGSGDALAEALKALKKWLGKTRSTEDASDDEVVDSEAVSDETVADEALGFTGPFPRSLKKIERMAALLESDGATHFWGT